MDHARADAVGPDPARSPLDGHRLGEALDGEFRRAIDRAERFAATGRDVTRAGIDRLLEITAGQPYDTQELARFLWAISEGRPATPAMVDEAFFPGTSWRSNFICNLGKGDPASIFDRSPRPDFDTFNRMA